MHMSKKPQAWPWGMYLTSASKQVKRNNAKYNERYKMQHNQ